MARRRATVKTEVEHEDRIFPPATAIEDIDSEEEEEDDEDDETMRDDNPEEYTPPLKLRQHQWHRQTISELIDLMNTPYLILDPDYQRNVVWSPERMTRLINSLMSNYYVPPLIFNVKKITVDNGSQRKQKICIDGKQRLSSIKSFVEGAIPCLDHKKRKWYYKDNGTSAKGKRKLLSESQKAYFNSLELLTVEYDELKLEQEEELFARVQMGMELRPAEKLKARTGPWQKFAIELESMFPELMAKIDNKRARAFQANLSTFRTLLSDEDKPTYSTGMSTLGPFLEKTQLLDDEFKKRMVSVFARFNEVFLNHPQIFENNNYGHSTKFSPIEFVGVACLIDKYPNRSVNMLAGDIRHMRQFLRQERQELRSNSTTFRAITSYIENLEKYRGGQGVISEEDRKPVIVDDTDSEEDDMPAPKKPRSKGTRAKGNQLSLPPPPTPSASSTGSSSRRTSAPKGKGRSNSSSGNTPSGANTVKKAAPPPPTAPLALREKENRQRQHQHDMVTPTAPMSYYNNNSNNSPSTRDFDHRYRTNFPSPGSGGGTSTIPGTNRPGFKAINTASFLPDLDLDVNNNNSQNTAYPPPQRKRARADDDNDIEMSDDLDLSFSPRPRGTNSYLPPQPPPPPPPPPSSYSAGRRSEDYNPYGYRGGSRGYGTPRGGGYRGRGGAQQQARTPRFKEERGTTNSGVRNAPRELHYGPFTMEE